MQAWRCGMFVNFKGVPSPVRSEVPRSSASVAHAGLCAMALQWGMVSRRCEGASSTLLWLDAEVCGVAARLHLLDAVGVVAAAAAAADATDTAGGRCAAASMQLVDGLQALLGPRLLQGGPQGDHSREVQVADHGRKWSGPIWPCRRSVFLETDNRSREALQDLPHWPSKAYAFRTRGASHLSEQRRQAVGRVICGPVLACTCCCAGCCEAALLVELLSAALAPLLEHLQAWLAHGLLDDPCREFFIVAGTPTFPTILTIMRTQMCIDGQLLEATHPVQDVRYFCRIAVVPLTAVDSVIIGHMRMCMHTGADVQVDSPDFWRSGYHARGSSDSGGTAAPPFMLPFLDGIVAAGKARVLLRHEQATAAAPPAAAGFEHGLTAPAAGPATGGSQRAERGLSQLCQERLKAAVLAQLQAARSGSSGKLGAPFGTAAGGAQGYPAARMRAAAAAHCLAPALSEPVGHSVAAAQSGTAATEISNQTNAVAGCWPQPASSWSASLQQVTACLPPLLLPPPVHNLHLPYLTTLTILHMSRFTQSSSQQIPEAYTAAILAASCVARIFKDHLARGGIRFLGGISSWYVGIALMALSHTQRIETLAKSGWEDVKVLQQALSNLATEWPSAAVFVKGFERLRLFDQPASKLGQDAFNSLYQNTPDESTSPTLSDGDVFSGIDWVRYFPFATAQTSSLARILLAKHQTDLWADISWLGDPSSHLQTFFDSSEMYFDVMGHSWEPTGEGH